VAGTKKSKTSRGPTKRNEKKTYKDGLVTKNTAAEFFQERKKIYA